MFEFEETNNELNSIDVQTMLNVGSLAYVQTRLLFEQIAPEQFTEEHDTKTSTTLIYVAALLVKASYLSDRGNTQSSKEQIADKGAMYFEHLLMDMDDQIVHGFIELCQKQHQLAIKQRDAAKT